MKLSIESSNLGYELKMSGETTDEAGIDELLNIMVALLIAYGFHPETVIDGLKNYASDSE